MGAEFAHSSMCDWLCGGEGQASTSDIDDVVHEDEPLETVVGRASPWPSASTTHANELLRTAHEGIEAILWRFYRGFRPRYHLIPP